MLAAGDTSIWKQAMNNGFTEDAQLTADVQDIHDSANEVTVLNELHCAIASLFLTFAALAGNGEILLGNCGHLGLLLGQDIAQAGQDIA